MLFTDGKEVFAFNVVSGKGEVQSVLSDLTGVRSLAVDKNRGYLFVASSSTSGKSHVDRYAFAVEVSQEGDTLTVNSTSKTEVYSGRNVKSLAIDDDESILYVADTESARIDEIKYSGHVRQLANSEIGLVKTLYSEEDVSSLAKVTSLAVDYLGNLFWTTSSQGKTQGAVMEASADSPNPASAKIVSKLLASAGSLCYSRNFLFYSGPDATLENDAENSAVYYKRLPRSGEIAKDLKMIGTGFTDVVAIGSFDNSFVYIADADLGFFAMEAFENDEFSEPVPIPMTI